MITPKMISDYVSTHVRFRALVVVERKALTLGRIGKALSLLPDETLQMFILGARDLTITFIPSPSIPFPMRTETSGPLGNRKYEIIALDEHQDWPEDLFLGALLRELGHVAAQRPPESEWPAPRGDRARFREKLECTADAMVWLWGLRHYSMRHLHETYPPHWVDRIVPEIEKTLIEIR